MDDQIYQANVLYGSDFRSDGLPISFRNPRTILWSPYEESAFHAHHITMVANLPEPCFHHGIAVPPFYDGRLSSVNNRSSQMGFDGLNNTALAEGDARVTRKRTVEMNCSDKQSGPSEVKGTGQNNTPHLQKKISAVYVDQKVKCKQPEDKRRKPTRSSSTFPCHVCNKVYAHHSSLCIHMRTHTGNKPHRCTYCQKAFSQSGNLKVHMRIHTNERPYSCSCCHKSFKQLSALRSHEYLHIRAKYL